MKFSYVAFGAFLGLQAAAIPANPFAQAGCAKDACLQKVIQADNPSDKGSCQAFFMKTVIPKTIFKTTTISKTVTSRFTASKTLKTSITTTKVISTTQIIPTTTTTTTTFSRVWGNKLKRDNTAVTTSMTTVPAYASKVCTDTDQYSSACYCINASHKTTTAPTPTVTSTSTVQSTTKKTVATTTGTQTIIISTVTSTAVRTKTATTTSIVTLTTCDPSTTTPTLVLANPTPLADHSQEYDDEAVVFSLRWFVGLFGTFSNQVWVGVNGYIALKMDDSGSYGKYYQNMPLPAWTSTNSPQNSLPDVAFAPFWDDLAIHQGTNQGIYYEYDGFAPDRTLRIEWLAAHNTNDTQYYHFMVTIPETITDTNNIKFTYYEIADSGLSATVGAQNTDGGYSQYSFNQPVITPGLELTYNTNTRVFEATKLGCVRIN